MLPHPGFKITDAFLQLRDRCPLLGDCRLLLNNQCLQGGDHGMASLNRTCNETHPAPYPRHDPVNGYRHEIATCRVTFARVPSAHVEVVAAAEASFREEGIAVTRLVPPGNGATFAEARLAEWVTGYRPADWPPPDPHGEVPGEPPLSRLPADWWVPVAIATDQPIREVISEAALGGG